MTLEPYWSDDTVTLYVGDCIDVLRGMPDASVDAVVCDPPYALPGGFMGKSWDRFEGRENAAFAYWFAGLVDGEGCFTIKRHPRGTFSTTFALKMRRDERGTLEHIHRTLGVGTIRDLPGDGGSKPQTVFLVQDKAGCQRLVDLFDKYPLRAKKRLDFAVWREAVCEWTDRPRGNRWRGAADPTRMAALKGRLEGVRRYVDPPWSGHEFQDWCRLWAAECLRVLKPGGHLVAFGGTRTWHRLAVAIEDAGFEIRDSLQWLYGAGFPKSLDVSKAIDKVAGVEREVIGRIASPAANGRAGTVAMGGAWQDVPMLTAPATDEARRWNGWGTALKPAWEPIVLARKPLAGTVAANVLEHGTGAVNIAACRVEPTGESHPRVGEASQERRYTDKGSTDFAPLPGVRGGAPEGRWPTNLLFTHSAVCVKDGPCERDCPVAELDRQSGRSASKASNRGERHGAIYGGGLGPSGPATVRGHNDAGGASRYFPTFRYEAKAPSSERPKLADGTAHATVKPLDLMRWLIRLVTPPGGTVLDPFAGSGTTGEACVLEGFRAVLVELEQPHAELIKARLSKPLQPSLDLFGEVADA